jgi:hypothetical protein
VTIEFTAYPTKVKQEKVIDLAVGEEQSVELGDGG